MTNEKQLEIREYLAKAMGYEIEDRKWVRPHEHATPSRLVLTRPEWKTTHGWPGSCLEFSNWSPFTSAFDLLELVEWARKQDWFLGMQLDMNGQLAIDIVMPGKFSQSTSEGGFQEAFPLAVYQALQEIEKS